MDQLATDDSTMTPLEAQRARLRAFADSLMETLETIERPKTYVDIERAARAAMMIDRLMVQLYSAPAKAPAPSLSIAYPSPSAPAAHVSRLPASPSRPVSAAPADQGEDAPDPDSDDETPLMSDAAFEAWEERFVSRFEDLIEAKKQGIALTAESAADVFLPLDTLMSLPHNVGLVLGTPLSNEGEIMVPMFNIPLQATTAIELTQWNPAQNLAHVRYNYAPTAASMKSFVREGIPKVMTRMSAPADAIASFNKELATLKDSDIMQLSTHCDFDVAIDTSLITKGKCTKVAKLTIGATKADKTESWEFSETLVN